MITRRTFLAGSGAAVLAAACARGARSPAETVRFSNWPYYIDEETMDGFEKASGLSVTYTEDINDNDEFFAKIREPLSKGRTIDRDIIVLTDSTAARLVRLGWVQEIDGTRVPNRSNLIDALRSPGFDPERRFTLPWVAGITGLAYNLDKTGRELKSVNDLFDEKLKGHVTMLSEMEDTLGLVMLASGKDPATAKAEDVRAAAERVKQARDKGQIRRFTGDDYGPDLARGDVWAALAWSGDVIQLQADNASLRFVVPDEGGIIWSDEMMIPKGAANKAGAEKLMNYYYRPEVAAKLIAEVEFICPVKGIEKVDSELAANPLIVPTAEMTAKLHSFRALSDDEDREFKELFQSIIRS